MVKIITTSRKIPAPLDRVWDIISNTDGEPQYWRDLPVVYDIRKKGNNIERDVMVDPRELKGRQTVALYPKKSIELTLTEGPMIGTRTITLIPSSSDNEIKTATATATGTTTIHVSWDVKLSDNIPPLFRGIVRERIAEATDEALDRIARAVQY
jgi:uncharacterized protein YndB with AHSA1/START domain